MCFVDTNLDSNLHEPDPLFQMKFLSKANRIRIFQLTRGHKAFLFGSFTLNICVHVKIDVHSL